MSVSERPIHVAATLRDAAEWVLQPRQREGWNHGGTVSLVVLPPCPLRLPKRYNSKRAAWQAWASKSISAMIVAQTLLEAFDGSMTRQAFLQGGEP